MIKIFLIGNFRYTPFRGYNCIDKPFLDANNIEITSNISEADILMSQNRKHLVKYFYKYLWKKKYLIWTNEPRFNTHLKGTKKEVFGLLKCHVMNLYTEDVFVSPLSFHGHLFSDTIKELDTTFQFKSKKVVALISFYKGLNTPGVWKNNEDIDLIKVRTNIALEGYKLGALDIFGKGWPKGVSMEDSRSGNWVGRKAQILEDYAFNLCFENTTTYNYVTEKIWDSIKHYCLPIYYGKNTGIYDLFPKNSFIDYSLFDTPELLFNFIHDLTSEEYIIRMNKCIEAYNSICLKGKLYLDKERSFMLQAAVDKIHSL